MKKINIIFCGSSKFSLENLKYIYKINFYCNIVYIMLKNKINKNIKLIINFANKNNIKIIYIININKEIDIINNIIIKNKIELIICCSFGVIFPKKIFNIIKYGIINIHASILPEFKGPSPIFYTLFNEKKISGITIFKINEIIDDGDIIYKSFFYIKKNEKYTNLYKRLYKFSSYLIINILKNIKNKKNIIINKCNNLNINNSYTKKINKNLFEIKWNYEVKFIDKIIRLSTNEIKSFFLYKNINIKIINHEYIYDKNINSNFGKIYLINNYGVYIKVLNGFIVLKRIQFPNKNPIYIKDLLNYNKYFFIINQNII